VLGRPGPDLLGRIAVGERLAVEIVLLRDLLGPTEAEHQSADAACPCIFQRFGVGARHVQRGMRIL
jgi:hypothetical protein